MKHIGVAIAGCGMIAGIHVTALKAIPEAQICGVWSHLPEEMSAFALKNGVDTYENYEQLLADPKVNTVIITLPPGLHVDYALPAVAAGKNLILEKPMDINLPKARRLIEEYRQKGLKLAVIFQNRYTPAVQKIKAALEQGILGKIILADAYVKWYRTAEYYASNSWRGTWEIEGGGALINQAIHTIDLVQWLMGGAHSVYGKIKTTTHRIATEDLGVALVEYNNGALGVIEGSTAVVPGFKERIEIHGQKGTIILEGGNIKEWKVEGCRESDYVASETITYGETNSPALSPVNYQAQLQEILQAIINNNDPLVTGEEGIKSLQIIRGIYESSRLEKKIILSTL